MAEYYTSPIWKYRENDLSENISPDLLNISEDLRKSLMDWAYEYDSILNIHDPVLSGFKSENGRLNFVKNGKLLFEKLKKELGNEYEVEFPENIY